MRLSSSASAVASAQELLEQLKKENAMLLADNERLLSHVEGLESTGRGSATAGEHCPQLLHNNCVIMVEVKGLSPGTSETGMNAKTGRLRECIMTVHSRDQGAPSQAHPEITGNCWRTLCS